MGTPLSKVTEQEMKAIERQIANNVDEEMSGEPIASPVSYLLREWDAQKQDLFDNVFHGELILSRHVIFTKNASQICSEIDNGWERTLSMAGQKFWNDFTRFCQQQRRNLYEDGWRYSLSPEQVEIEQNWYRCENILTNEVLAANAVEEEFVINLPKPDGTFRPYRVQKGSRPIRVLTRLNRAFHFGDEDGLKDIAVWQSRYLNDKKVEGEFCLSIHPLDYMTMSENNCDWTSCMNWPENGCYRGGTIEMMNSPMVIVVYMKSAKDPLMMDMGWDPEAKKREYLEWNSKKWRTLICVNAHGIFSVKGYPYQHDEMTKFAMEWIASLFDSRCFNEVRKFRPYRTICLDRDDGAFINISPRTYRMYNDFGSCDHFMMLDKEYQDYLRTDETNYLSFVYSGASECMNCGALSYIDNANGVYFNSEERITCDSCCHIINENELACDLCGAVWDSEDMIWVGDTPVCPDCFDTECFEDAWTYEYGFNDDAVIFYIQETDKKKPTEIGKCISSNVIYWIEEDKRDQYMLDIRKGEVTVKEADLNDIGLSHLKRERAARERRHSWSF